MTIETKIAIDNKITELGFKGCLDFFIKTQLDPFVTAKLTSLNFRHITRSHLAGNDWDDLTELFLNWKRCNAI